MLNEGQEILSPSLPKARFHETAEPYRRIPLIRGTMVHTGESSSRFAHIVLSGMVCTSVLTQNGSLAAVHLSRVGDLLDPDQIFGGLRRGRSTVTRVLASGELLRVPTSSLRQLLDQQSRLRDTLLADLCSQISEIEQISVCNLLHPLDRRLARHLLTMHSRSKGANISITQQELADHLGVQRTSLVTAAGGLRHRNLIDFRRGAITITDLAGLKSAACECYGVIAALDQERTHGRSVTVEDALVGMPASSHVA